jgi:nucleotide-binding universal stress UspA family protein
VAEDVLRNASVPVYIVGPEVVEGNYRHYVARNILCSVSAYESSRVVACFSAELAAKYNAGLILQQAIPPQNCAELLAGRTLAQVEEELRALVPEELQGKIHLRARAMLGDPTEELLLQGRAQHASLIVMGAQGASHFAAISRAGVVYKVLAYAQCPVITLSPAVLAECGGGKETRLLSEPCMAGVF